MPPCGRRRRLTPGPHLAVRPLARRREVTLGVTRRGSRGDGAKLLHAQCKVEIAIVMVLSGVVVKESVVSKVAVMVLSEEFVKESVVSKGTTTNVSSI